MVEYGRGELKGDRYNKFTAKHWGSTIALYDTKKSTPKAETTIKYDVEQTYYSVDRSFITARKFNFPKYYAFESSQTVLSRTQSNSFRFSGIEQPSYKSPASY
ncbi:MAG: hypothetical protein ABI262_13500 [Microcoleus sp.]